ncbi:hypothetical protein CRYUN_Cryun37aG0113000 [Craigia yunnanensis]
MSLNGKQTVIPRKSSVSVETRVIEFCIYGRLEWVNSYGKKQCRSLFWRVKAALKKAVKSRRKQHFKFQYDPSRYALNFDDGCCRSGVRANTMELARFQDCSVLVVESRRVKLVARVSGW